MRDREFNISWAMKYYREKRGMTQGDVCRATGLERAYVSRLELKHIPNPRLTTCRKLARAFGVSTAEFVQVAELHELLKVEEYLSGRVPTKQ